MYETWHTKQEAATLLAASVKTVERLAAGGEIQQAERPVAGKRPAAVYHPDDVARLAAAKAPKPHIMPPEDLSVLAPSDAAWSTREEKQPGAMIVPQPTANAAAVAAAFGTWAQGFTWPAAARPETPRRFLTLPEASEHSGLSITYLKRVAGIANGYEDSRTIEAIKDGRRWKLRKDDVDKL
jgi:hypothetical protein